MIDFLVLLLWQVIGVYMYIILTHCITCINMQMLTLFSSLLALVEADGKQRWIRTTGHWCRILLLQCIPPIFLPQHRHRPTQPSQYHSLQSQVIGCQHIRIYMYLRFSQWLSPRYSTLFFEPAYGAWVITWCRLWLLLPAVQRIYMYLHVFVIKHMESNMSRWEFWITRVLIVPSSHCQSSVSHQVVKIEIAYSSFVWLCWKMQTCLYLLVYPFAAHRIV